MEYIVDLTGVETPEAFHERVRAVLPVPPRYGGSLDALYDVLTERGAGWTVRFTNAGSLRAVRPRYAASLERLCRDVQAAGVTAEVRD